MNDKRLIAGNRAYFTRYYKLVAFAAIITTAVITGSLVVGDSVRSTLENRVNERLGNTETVIFSMNSFIDSSLVHHPVFEGNTRAILTTNGFISHSGRLIPVMVWGVNDLSVSSGKARVNESLAKELSMSSGDIVLRLPATGMVPSGSLFVTENYTTSMRLALDGMVDLKQGGNLSLKNEQALPYNIFVNRNELATTLETEGKVNLLLSNRIISPDDFNTAWNPAFSGLKTKPGDGYTEITSERIFIQEKVVQTIGNQNTQPNRLFSYLVNSIEYNVQSIPYSFVTAMDQYQGKPLNIDEIILSDYAARRLQVKEKDTLSLSFYTSQDLKTLRTDTLKLCISRIVPLPELVADPALSADFPGLSNVERCTDWNSDLPINMKMITDEDESYWNDYRTTPKAIIPYQAVAPEWANSFGSATALRVSNGNVNMEGLAPEMFGIQLSHPRAMAYHAARSGVDFSGLFLSLGFFIILSAMLLMLIPLSEMLYRRRHEITLLRSLGYAPKRIIRLLWLESVPTVLWSSVIGVAAGLVYTYLILFLLGTVWKGATHTEGFSVYPHIQTILAGLLTGIILSLLLLRATIVRSLKNATQRKKKNTHSFRWKMAGAILLTLFVVLTAFINLAFVQSPVWFMVIGVSFIGATAFWGDYLVCRNGTPAIKSFRVDRLVWATLFAGRKQALLSFFTLSMGVFIVFSVGLNRKGFADSSQILTGTGGYTLWCESSVPVYHNISTPLGREKLALTELPVDAEVLQFLRYSADDASCLNLNKVSNPTVLGVDMEQLGRSHFKIEQRIEHTDRGNAFESLRTRTDSVYPALVDATVLTWGLGLKLGDTIVYEGSKGQRAVLRLAGTLQNSIFQGNLLIDRKLFPEIWDEITGSEVMLVKVNEHETEDTKMLISQALSNYGVSVTTTADRLNQFYSVTDTYLTIFLMLGSIGLLLGIMSFVIVIRKNLTARKEEIALYRSLGFTDRKITGFLYSENRIVPLYAIATGVAGALLSAGGGLANVGLWIWVISFVFAVLFVVCALVFIRKTVRNIVQDS